jgi:hypothetical protein
MLATGCSEVAKKGARPNNPPEVDIALLEDGAYIFGMVNLTGTAVDDKGVTAVQVKQGTDPATPWAEAQFTESTPGNASWTYNFDSTELPDTSLYIQVKATDTQEAVNFAFVTVIVDNIGPAVNIITPSDERAVAPNEHQAVSGYVPLVGIASKVDRVEISIDGGAWFDAEGSVVWSHVLDTTGMTQGEHTLSARGVRNFPAAVGHERSVTFIVDKDVPEIAITSPLAGSILKESIYIDGTAGDNTGLSKVEVSTDGGLTYQTATGSETWELQLDTTTLADGSARPIIARAVDITGLIGSTQVIFIVDNNAPTVFVTSHEDGDLVRGIVHFVGTASDAVSVQSVRVNFDGTGFVAANGATSWTYDFNTITPYRANGVKNVVVRAADYADFTTDYSFTVVLDQNDPLFGAFSGIAANARFNGTASISGSVSDPDVGDSIASVEYRVNGGEFTADGLSGIDTFSYEWDTLSLDEGPQTIVFRATDNWGAYTDTTFNVVIDRTKPEAAITSPINESPPVKVGGIVTIEGTADDNDGIAVLTLDIDLDGNMGNGFEKSVDVLPNLSGQYWYYNWNTNAFGEEALVDADHDLRITATDRAGNVSEPHTITVYKSSDVPSATIDDPITGSHERGEIRIVGTATAEGATVEIDSVEVSIDGGSYVPAVDDSGAEPAWSSWYYDLDTMELDDGPRTITVRVTDTTDPDPLWSLTQVTIVVDNTTPEISITEPTSDNNGANDDHSFDNYLYGTVNIRGDSSDANLYAVYVGIDVDDADVNIPVTGTTSFTYEWNTTTLANMAKNDVVIKVKAVDLAGNEAIDSVTVDVRPRIFSMNKTAINPGDLGTSPLIIFGSNFAATGITVYLDNDGAGPLTGGVAATTISRVDSGTINVSAVNSASTSGPLWITTAGGSIASNSEHLDVWTVSTVVATLKLSSIVSGGGNSYFSYVSADLRTPYLARFNGTTWTTGIAIDMSKNPPQPGEYGESAVVRTSRNYVYVVYHKSNSNWTNPGLRWNVSDDNGVSFDTTGLGNTNAQMITGGTNITMPSLTGYYNTAVGQDYLYATWYDTTTLDLMFARSLNSGANWTGSTIESTGNVGRYSSAGLTFDGDDPVVVVAYFDQTNRDLKYAYSDNHGASWTISTIDGQGGDSVGEWISLKVASDGGVHISYFDSYTGLIKLASAGAYDQMFDFDEITDEGLGGWNTGLVLDLLDNPYLCFYNASFGSMRYAYRYMGQWMIAGVPEAGIVTFPNPQSSIGISGSTPGIVYLAGGNVRFATFKP